MNEKYSVLNKVQFKFYGTQEKATRHEKIQKNNPKNNEEKK